MKEFFRGWRRKAGCVALLMALPLMCGWISSTIVTSHWRLHKGDFEYQCLISSQGQIAWMRLAPYELKARTRKDSVIDMHSPEVRFQRIVPVLADRAMVAGFRIDGTYEWKRGFCGVEVGEIRYQHGSSGDIRASIWTARYSSLVIPLMLLSACLILWKQRKRA